MKLNIENNSFSNDKCFSSIGSQVIVEECGSNCFSPFSNTTFIDTVTINEPIIEIEFDGISETNDSFSTFDSNHLSNRKVSCSNNNDIADIDNIETSLALSE